MSITLTAMFIQTVCASGALAQSISRPVFRHRREEPGPACLVARQSIGKLPDAVVYRHLHVYPDALSACHRPCTEIPYCWPSSIDLGNVAGVAWRSAQQSQARTVTAFA